MANKKSKSPGGREITTEYKLLVVQARLKGAGVEDIAKAFGVSSAAVQRWTKAFRERGPDALVSKRGQHWVKMKPKHPAREQVVALKREHDNWGTRRIRDVLARFSALGVSEQQVANYRFAAVKKLSEQIRAAGLPVDVFPELKAAEN